LFGRFSARKCIWPQKGGGGNALCYSVVALGIVRMSCTLILVLHRYAFHKEKAGGKDEEGKKKERLLKIFGPWTDMVTDLIKATPEEDVLRRDIFDRPPVFRYSQF